MAILKNQEIWYARLDPEHPERKLDPTKPNWQIQIRTKSKEVRKMWNDMQLRNKVVRADKTDEESPVLYYSANLRKSAQKIDKTTKEVTKAKPVDVVNGRGEEIDPTTIGNGSVGNLILFRRDYEHKGLKGVSYTLMRIQITKHVKYIAKPMEEFDDCETEVIEPSEDDELGESTPTAGTPTPPETDEY